MAEPIDPRVDIGHIHLKVADLDRSLAFYNGVLGFELTARMGSSAAFLSAGGYHHHIGLNTWESHNGTSPAPGTTGLYHVAIRYPDRAALADALRRLNDAHVPLEGASDHGVSEALYVRDPDGNGLELYWDRAKDQWPRGADGSIQMTSERLDIEALLEEGRGPRPAATPADSPPMSTDTRTRLAELRSRLLALHKTLLDDAKTAYEMDRGRIPSAGALLQLVIGDPWFAWLHQLSGLIIRIDETNAAEAKATEADARALFEQVDRLLIASETGADFARRYFEALQRQPAVVLAHGDVKQVLRG
jgi:catechol 2,3-dioxygenase